MSSLQQQHQLPDLDNVTSDAPRAELLDEPARASRERQLVAIGLVGLVAVLALVIAITTTATRSDATTTVRAAAPAAAAPAAAAASTSAPTLADAKGVRFEQYEKVDPTLPAVPAGAVKRFTVDVDQHVVQVSPDLAPTQAWTYTVNGKLYKGTAASPPIVVDQGDRVQITFVNGGSKAMHVNMAHSVDFHSAEVAPSKYYVDVAPGKSEVIDFVARHPGVFMYHCATQPVLMHVGNGMAGMMVVRPKGLAPVDKELWITQGEYYLGAPGAPADMKKLEAETPDVVAFNGYANQYKTNPITVRRGERIRLWVLNTGPSKWSAFHVIGTVFDRAVVENRAFPDSQTMNLAPSQGGYAEFTLDQEGNYPFVTHAFGDMVKGAAGILHTSGAPMPKLPAAAAPAAAQAAMPTGKAAGTMVDVSLGEFFVKLPSTTLKAGTYTFMAKNDGSTAHMLMIGRAPVKMSGPNQPAMGAGLGDTGDIQPGQSKNLTVKLTPGTYEFFCNVPGHYAANQKTTVTVTG